MQIFICVLFSEIQQRFQIIYWNINRSREKSVDYLREYFHQNQTEVTFRLQG